MCALLASHTWRLWSSLTNALPSPTPSTPSRAVNCNNSVQVSLNIINPIIYQRGLSPRETRLQSSQVLRGYVTVTVIRPTQIKDIVVVFHGARSETLGMVSTPIQTLIDDRFWWNEDAPFPLGIYTYPFNFVVDASLPESIRSSFVSTAYNMEASVSFHDPILNEHRVLRETSPITIVRCVSDEVALSSESVCASGNWRNIMVYEFCLQNKIAFQDSQFNVSVLLHRINPLLDNFRIYTVSICLLQRVSYAERPGGSRKHKRHLETSKFVLYKQDLSHEDVTKGTAPDGTIVLGCKFRMPASTELHEDILSSKPWKSIYPGVPGDDDSKISISHVLKSSFEVSETRPTLFTPPSVKSRASEPSRSKHGHHNADNSSPGYSAFHARRDDFTRYKKVELSFSSPITILNAQSIEGTSSPPSYTTNTDVPDLEYFSSIRDVKSKDFQGLERLKSKGSLSRIVPPQYETVTM